MKSPNITSWGGAGGGQSLSESVVFAKASSFKITCWSDKEGLAGSPDLLTALEKEKNLERLKKKKKTHSEKFPELMLGASVMVG